MATAPPNPRRRAAAGGKDAAVASPAQPKPKSPPRLATETSASSTSFYASQVTDASVINYCYTDMPWRLVAYDMYQFLRLAWALPYIVWPVSPTDSGPMSELALTMPNLRCMAVHGLLVLLQLAFVLGLLPALVFLPVWAATAAIGFCLGLNSALCMLLNGSGIEYHSNPDCAPARPEHAHEQWIFLNGVAVGQHWMQSNLDRLALTFKRPILGIHNKTDGIIFDVIECLIQRNFSYATTDVRLAYRILRDNLYRPGISKVVFILHSQGSIEGGLVLDWLLQELPQDLLAKLEVYTFGNAANHFNNPYRTVEAQCQELAHTTALTPALTTAAHGELPGLAAARRGDAAQAAPRLVTETSASHPAATSHRAIGHIEHYAHTFDFVALWGVLHFVSTIRGSPTMPRFLGRVFARTSPRGGHQLCQHYLDGMFPLARDPETGAFVGCLETGNEFMESDVEIAREGDESANVHEAYEQSWVAAMKEEMEMELDGDGGRTRRAELVAGVEIHASSPVLARQASQPRIAKVKDVSRLWQYRNGRSPDDRLRGISRLATM